MPQAIPMIMMAGGTAMSVIGSIQEGNQAKAAEKYNASVLEQRAKNTQISAQFDIDRQRRAARELQGKQKAAYAKAGVQMTGSPLQTIADSAAQAEMDSLITKWNADTESSMLKSEADYHRVLGRNYAKAGYMKAGSTLLSQGSGMFSQLKK